MLKQKITISSIIFPKKMGVHCLFQIWFPRCVCPEVGLPKKINCLSKTEQIIHNICMPKVTKYQ